MSLSDTKESLDDIMIINRSLSSSEIEVFYENIDQEALVIIPDIDPSNRCKIPGSKTGPLPTDIIPESNAPIWAESEIFHLTNKWTCLALSYHDFIVERWRFLWKCLK